MIYSVKMNGINIYGPKPELILINPKVTMELNTSGSFDFTMPPSHIFYDEISLMKTIIEVYEENELIFYGRPSEIKKDWLNRKIVHCEGALSYLNDVTLRPKKYEKVLLTDLFKGIINDYNALVDNDKKFTVGQITINDRFVSRDVSYESAFSVIGESCVGVAGGYLFVNASGGILTVDWLKDMPYSSDQPIQFGINLMDITSDISCSDVVSSIIPLGATIRDEQTGTESRLTISSVNAGKDYLEIPLWKDSYGKIERPVDFGEITDPSELLSQAQKYINGIITDILVIECDAADLHFVDDQYHQFKVGQTINVASTPHNINVNLPLTKIDVDISTAVKKIRIGTPPRDGISAMSGGGGNTITYSGGGGGGGGSSVTYTPIITEGTKLGTITIDSIPNDIYAPTGSGSNDVFLTKAQYDALPDTKLTDGKHYYLTDYTEGGGY